MNVHISDEAEADLLAGFVFYEQQNPGLGNYFLEILHAGIESLGLYAGIHRKIFGYHRMLPERFPYEVFYRIDGDDVTVVRVFDCRRDPRWIERQMRMQPE